MKLKRLREDFVVRELSDGTVMLNPHARALLEGEVFDVTARAVAQADTTVTVGLAGPDTDGQLVVQGEIVRLN